jgi:signal transduction histidine kinase
VRRRITLLVGATTSAVVVAFIVPLCLLVANLAEDRAINQARQLVQGVATVVATVPTNSLENTVDLFVSEGARVTVVTAGGEAYGSDAATAPSQAAVIQARESLTAFTDQTAEGVQIVVPVTTAEGISVVTTTVPSASLRAGVNQAWATIIGLGTLIVVLSVTIARGLGGRVSTPVIRLADIAHRLRAGDLAARARPEGTRETVELAEALNLLADRIEQLVADERENVADLGHRLRTPVTALRLDTDLVSDPDLADRLRDHVDHLQRSIDAVVREARRSVREALPEAADAVRVVTDRVEFWRPLAEDQGREVSLHVPVGPLMVRLPAVDVRELVDTLLDNVFAHTPEGSALSVGLAEDGTNAVLTVADGGPGLEGVTDLALRRGASGSGSTGLGLDIVRRLAESANGEVTLDRSVLGGLAVHVRLALARG